MTIAYRLSLVKAPDTPVGTPPPPLRHLGNLLSKSENRQDEHYDYDEPDDIDDAIHNDVPLRSATVVNRRPRGDQS